MHQGVGQGQEERGAEVPRKAKVVWKEWTGREREEETLHTCPHPPRIHDVNHKLDEAKERAPYTLVHSPCKKSMEGKSWRGQTHSRLRFSDGEELARGEKGGKEKGQLGREREKGWPKSPAS